jgi:hypothetical protein
MPMEDAVGESISSPWMSTPPTRTNNDGVNDGSKTQNVGFVSVCIQMMDWCVDCINKMTVDDDNDRVKADEKRNDNPDKLEGELICEILSVFYALRIGPELLEMKSMMTSSSTSSSSRNAFASVLFKILRLPSSQKSESNHPNYYKQCKLSVISILMDDSGYSFIQCLTTERGGSTDNNENDDKDAAIDALLDILSTQIEDVVDNTRVDHSATASLVPILVVTNKYCSANRLFLDRTKSFMFPPESEHIFQQNVERFMSRTRNTTGGVVHKPTTMSPLMDVPKDTIRGRLVTLLSWPESYIKRCTSELLWTIVQQNVEEYILRVGMGNAMPLLSAKGLAPIQIPP